MYREVADAKIFLKFWEDESNMPRWFHDGSGAWHTTAEDFLGFCQQCWKVYLVNEIALVYLEKITPKVISIHLSVLRGKDTSNWIPEFIAIKEQILKEFEMLFGWVGKHNRGLQKIIESVGFKHYGFKMFYGVSHNKVLEWRCYSVTRNNLVKDTEKLLLSM